MAEDTAPGGFPLGVLPSPPDERDYPYPAFAHVYRAAELPEEYVLPGLGDVDNQGSVGSCVAHSLACIKDWQERQEVGWPVRVSRQWIYHYRPNSYYHQGPGMIPREALATLCRHGVVLERLWPGITERGREVWPAPAEALLPEAQPFRVATYVRVDAGRITEVKSACYSLGPVLYCVPVHTNFAPDAAGSIPMPAGELRGYHAMAVVGWKPGSWLVQNSWGSAWGHGGRCWMPWNYPVLEVWTVTDAATVRERRVDLTIGSKTMLLDGKPVEMDVAPFIQDGRTFIPLRFAAEALGAEVDYAPKEGPVERVWAVRREYPWP